MNKGLTEGQVHRVREDLQRNALSLNCFKNKGDMLRALSKDRHMPVLGIIADGIDADGKLLKENLDALNNDMEGMLNGNGVKPPS